MPEDLSMRRSLVVLAPSPLLTITVEVEHDTREELHLHAGGQGLWVARMAAARATSTHEAQGRLWWQLHVGHA